VNFFSFKMMMQNGLGLCLALINEELPAQGKALKSWEILSLCKQTAKERESGRKVSAIEEGEGLTNVHTHMCTLSLSLSLLTSSTTKLHTQMTVALAHRAQEFGQRSCRVWYREKTSVSFFTVFIILLSITSVSSSTGTMSFLDHNIHGSTPISGGGFSENLKFDYGYSSLRGKRASMEDFHDIKLSIVDDQVVGLFGVFDGHGGSRAAEYVKKNLFENLLKHHKFVSDTKVAIAESYQQTDQDYLRTESSQNRDAGSTASTAVLVGDRLLVANVGDSRAVICRGGEAFALSSDHKPNRADERQRIEDAGRVVMWVGTWRVGGVLAVSRAFGDRLLKRYVVAEPEIQEDVIQKGVDFLILASDGLWDVVTNQEAVSMVKSIEDPEKAANKLTDEAYRRGSADNITCLIVRFNHDH
jgi:protein phosphatase 1L